MRSAALMRWVAGVVPPLLAIEGVTVADYERADRFRRELNELVYYGDVVPHWIGKSSRFWYRNYIPGGKEFVVADAERGSKQPAFDHERLAGALSRAAGGEYTAQGLPFDTFKVNPEKNVIIVVVEDFEYTADLKNYSITKGKRVDPPAGRRGRRRPGRQSQSPDGKWLAFVRDFNLYVRSIKSGEEIQLSRNGTEDRYYSSAVSWSPDSLKVAAYYETRGRETDVFLIRSSPEDQMRPTMESRPYALPGDVLTIGRPVVFFVEGRAPVKVHERWIENAFRVTDIHWWDDSCTFTFRFHERGEKLARILRGNAFTGEVEVVLEETAGTFLDRYNLYVHYSDKSREIIWSSERDGWRHLYLYDAEKGELKHQITSGDWVVRGIDWIDEDKRQIYFRAGGRETGQDPYNIHHYRIGFDGSGIEHLTPGEGSHTVSFSPDHKFYVDKHSRVDSPPVAVLKRTSDLGLVMELEKADISILLETGWRMPEPFVAKGRDGRTDIYGVIYRPSHFEAARSYPVIENIYAGPHGSFTPKTFRASRGDQALAELGFILVQLDGMGTANRSRAFHDVAWQNIADAGFPDRIAWLRAAAVRYPFMDISRMGIYGTSAGGQSSTGALLFHPDFYQVAVSSCGCHDNRMDKAVWNEQWMGYPVGPHYEAQSNVTNAHNLKGRLLLIVGEMDTNVPPQSTLQVVDALIKAEKDFDLLFLPGAGHTGGGDYGERRRRDYFVRHLLQVEPPEWNLREKTKD